MKREKKRAKRRQPRSKSGMGERMEHRRGKGLDERRYRKVGRRQENAIDSLVSESGSKSVSKSVRKSGSSLGKRAKSKSVSKSVRKSGSSVGRKKNAVVASTKVERLHGKKRVTSTRDVRNTKALIKQESRETYGMKVEEIKSTGLSKKRLVAEVKELVQEVKSEVAEELRCTQLMPVEQVRERNLSERRVDRGDVRENDVRDSIGEKGWKRLKGSNIAEARRNVERRVGGERPRTLDKAKEVGKRRRETARRVTYRLKTQKSVTRMGGSRRDTRGKGSKRLLRRNIWGDVKKSKKSRLIGGSQGNLKKNGVRETVRENKTPKKVREERLKRIIKEYIQVDYNELDEEEKRIKKNQTKKEYEKERMENLNKRRNAAEVRVKEVRSTRRSDRKKKEKVKVDRYSRRLKKYSKKVGGKLKQAGMYSRRTVRDRITPRREIQSMKKGSGVKLVPKGVGRNRGEFRRGKTFREGVKKLLAGEKRGVSVGVSSREAVGVESSEAVEQRGLSRQAVKENVVAGRVEEALAGNKTRKRGLTQGVRVERSNIAVKLYKV